MTQNAFCIGALIKLEDTMKLLSSTQIYAALIVSCFSLCGTRPGVSQENNTQTSELYKLQAAYHRAATVRDPVNGDLPAVITERLRDVLSLFTTDGVLYLQLG